MNGCKVPARDQELIQIVDAALAGAARKSGDWLVCRPGCTQCCVGIFEINQLDAARLRQGMLALETSSPERAAAVGNAGSGNQLPERAAAVRKRAEASIQRLAEEFPGDPRTGILYQDEESQKQFEDLANDEPCPALDPVTGLCELYEYRPMTCRVFGPPIRSEDGLGVCELCYQEATDEQIAACEMKPDPDDLESELLQEMDGSGQTIVAYCLKSPDRA